MSIYDRRADRLSLSRAQRQVIDSAGVEWLGWDAAHLPVIRRRGERFMAVGRDGVPVEVTFPLDGRAP